MVYTNISVDLAGSISLSCKMTSMPLYSITSILLNHFNEISLRKITFQSTRQDEPDYVKRVNAGRVLGVIFTDR